MIRRRAIIVDDLPPARDHLRDLLDLHQDIEIVGEAGDLASARRLILEKRPDVAFLDIQLGRDNGFDLLPVLEAAHVIFVTAYDAYAVRAFEANALDYLLKPIKAERLAASLARLGVPATIASSSAYALHDMVALQGEQLTRLAPVSWIALIAAERNYTKVYMTDGSFVLTRRTVSAWEQALPAEAFLRIDRSVFVQLATVQEVTLSAAGNARIRIAGRDEPITVTRRGGQRLIETLDGSSADGFTRPKRRP